MSRFAPRTEAPTRRTTQAPATKPAVVRRAPRHAPTSQSAPTESAAERWAPTLRRAAMGSALTTPGVAQARLKVSTPGDHWEQEADRVADAVLRTPDPPDRDHQPPGVLGSPAGGLPRVQRQRVAHDPEEALQRETRPGATPGAATVSPSVATALHDGGRPLEPGARAFFEPRFGTDFSSVRVHTSGQAAVSAQALEARAYTIGRDIVFNHGEYAPATSSGRRLLAHELTHVLQHGADRGAPDRVNRLTDTNGQHASGGLGDLTSDLTSPVVVNRRVRLEANFSHIPGDVPYGGPPGLSPVRYVWVVTDRTNGAEVARSTSMANAASISYPRTGRFRITCTLQGLTGSASVALEQDAVAEDGWLAGQLSSSSVDPGTVRELVDDFRQYVIDSATSTGPTGITPLFIAAILSEEISNTAVFGPDNQGARMSEIGDVASAIERRAAGQSVPVSDIDHSVGVAQIKLSTAAQLRGMIPWTEQDITQRRVARAQIATDFAALSTTGQANLLTMLRWPRSNIQTMAELLARLKNRHNRYPTLQRGTFGADMRACQVIATEYNLGSSTSEESDARPTSYGVTVWTRMREPIFTRYFPNS